MTTPKPPDVDWSEEVEISLQDGSTISMRRSETGGIELCHDNACLELPATAPQFLGILEFFQTLGNGVNDG